MSLCNFEPNDLEDVKKQYLGFHNEIIKFSSNYLRRRATFFMGRNVRHVTSFYLAVISELIMISWFIMTVAERCFRRSLLTIQTLVRLESMILYLLLQMHDYGFHNAENAVSR